MKVVRKTMIRKAFIVVSAIFMIGMAGVAYNINSTRVSAACAAPSTDYGYLTYSISVPSSGNYRLWSRIMAPDNANNSYMIEIDGNSCYVVGDKAIAPNAWTWVDYQNANEASKITANLSAGAHTVKFIGREPSVKVDRVLALTDTACSPSGTGDNCAVTSDTSAPDVTVTAPVDGATVSGAVNVSATATDDTAVTRVEFLINNTLETIDASAPYGFNWATQNLPNGSYDITARAYDAAGNVGSDTNTVTVKNGDSQTPTTPSNISATANSSNKVTVSWAASTDNVGVVGYTISRSGGAASVVFASNTSTYVDESVQPGTQYGYRVSAYDAAGNVSGYSSAVNVTTPTLGDTQAPTVPTAVNAAAVSTSQINLTWAASTDNVGVESYDIYRSTGGAATKVATVASLSYGDSGLRASTEYRYYVVAKDAAGNSSAQSETAVATTNAEPTQPSEEPVSQGVVRGVVRDNRRRGLANVTVTITSSNNNYYAKTNADGVYRIENVAEGRYSIKYRLHGYDTESDRIKVRNDRDVIKNIKLYKTHQRHWFWERWW